MRARAILGLAACTSLLGLVACNAIFGLDSLTYEPRPSIPLLPEEPDAGDGSAEADATSLLDADATSADSSADGADATPNDASDADPSDAADD